MSLTQISVLIIAVWLIISSQEPVGSTLTLILGVVAAVLVILDSPFVRSHRGAS